MNGILGIQWRERKNERKETTRGEHSSLTCEYIYHYSQTNEKVAIYATWGTPITMRKIPPCIRICIFSNLFILQIFWYELTKTIWMANRGMQNIQTAYLDFINYAEWQCCYDSDSFTFAAFIFWDGFCLFPFLFLTHTDTDI